MLSQTLRSRLQTESIGDVLVVNFVDRKILDEQNIQHLGEQLFALVEQNQKILLNFSRVESISSAAFGKLIAMNKRVKAADGRLMLCSMGASIYEAFELCKFDQILDVSQNEQTALQAF